MGSFGSNVTLTVIATLGLVFSAIYSLRLMQKVFLGQPAAHTSLPDLSLRETIIMASLTITIVFLGLYPQPVMDMVSQITNSKFLAP
jgi:NADH-quinone oxidoreductase subunit M